MKFWDREKEIKELKAYIESEPNSILFVYGPKSSGKSTLMMKIAQLLKSSPFQFLWYDLRGYAIEKTEDAISILLGAKGMPSTLSKLFDIQIFILSIKTEELMKIFKKEKDPFVLLEEELVKIREKGEIPVIIFDEIQNFKDIYINGDRKLIDRMFNFFVRLTKVQHISHVIVMTSDTFFIEEIYQNSSLENTSRYYLVDFFDDKTAEEILINEGFSKEIAEYIVSWIGGIPWAMVEVVEGSKYSNPKDIINDLYKNIKNSVSEKLGTLYEISPSIQKEALDLLERINKKQKIYPKGKDRNIIKILVEKEILYYDPINDRITPHTKLHEKAIKEILKNEEL